MNPDLYLQIAGTFLTYCLQLTAGVAVCMVLSRLSSAPDRRFRVWLGFMAAGGAYGLALITQAFMESLGRIDASPATAEAGRRLLLVPQPWKVSLVYFMPIVFRLYTVVAAALLLAALWRQVRLHLLLRYGRMPGENLARAFDAMRAQAGVGWCELRVVPGLGSPAMAFWWKPRILVPEVCEEMAESGALTGVLWHELVHVRRRDYLWAVASDLICSLLFFHPAVWQARARMRAERELACDQAVIAANPEARADYAESLTRFARLAMLEQHAATGIDFATPATFLSQRVRAILTEDERAPRWKTAARAIGSVALLAVFALLLPVMVVGMRFAAPAQAQVSSVLMAAGAGKRPTSQTHRQERAQTSAIAMDSAVINSAVQESGATRLAPRWREGTPLGDDDRTAGGIESEAGSLVQGSGDSQWQERSPSGTTGAGKASMKSVLLQTAGVLVGREERGGDHAPHKRLPGR
ncbi:MAG: hypothetical protein LAP21_15755 [Acidobacteriia bacterium]|nr:hypothetical protein [Terriglobia bacterium]